jgi:hypothetical protein
MFTENKTHCLRNSAYLESMGRKKKYSDHEIAAIQYYINANIRPSYKKKQKFILANNTFCPFL